MSFLQKKNLSLFKQRIVLVFKLPKNLWIIFDEENLELENILNLELLKNKRSFH